MVAEVYSFANLIERLTSTENNTNQIRVRYSCVRGNRSGIGRLCLFLHLIENSLYLPHGLVGSLPIESVAWSMTGF